MQATARVAFVVSSTLPARRRLIRDGQLKTSLVKTDEAQPLSRSIRAVRWFYYASMAVGFPLWLMVTFALVAWVWFTFWPLPDIGPVEFESPSAIQTGLLMAAGLVFFAVYPAAFFWAYRITRQPWVLFASMLLPVLTFCYAVAYFPIMDSNSEELAWLSYLGSLALVLIAGGIAASLSEHHQPANREAST